MGGIEDILKQARAEITEMAGVSASASADTPPPSKKQKIEETKKHTSNSIQHDFLLFDTFEAEIEENSKADLLATIEAQKQEIQRLKRENAKYCYQMEQVGKFLNVDQRERLTASASSTPTWSDFTIQKCMQAYAKMHGAYTFMRNNFFLPKLLPPKRTFQEHLTRIDCEPGECTDFITLTELKVPTMTDIEKNCVMNIDEMGIAPGVEYDSATQSYVGNITVPLSQKMQDERIKENGVYNPAVELAYHAISIVLVGLATNWRQLVAFHYTGKSFDPEFLAEWIKKVIIRVNSIGLSIQAIIMDMSTANQNI